MGKSIQTHYLPRGAYLTFFTCAEYQESLWMYQRDKEPILLRTEKAARERNLYCFRDKDGRFDSDIEESLGKMEELAFPVLKKLNTAQRDFDISAEEWDILANFVAFQAVRTPAFRRQLQNEYAELMKAVTQKIALDPRMFDVFVRAAGEGHPELDTQGLRSFILSGEYDIGASGDYFLGAALQCAPLMYRILLTKEPILLRSEQRSIITCDLPVILLRHSKSPLTWGRGWVNSNVLFPIGKSVALYMQVQLKEFTDQVHSSIRIKVKRVAEQKVDWVNRHVMTEAEAFLFADKSLKSINRKFRATQKPNRFTVSNWTWNPFVMLHRN